MQDGFATLTFQNGKSIEGNLTNGVFLVKEEEIYITIGTRRIGSETGNQGRWIFHENSYHDSFEGEIEHGEMKNGTLKSKDITSIGIPPFFENLIPENVTRWNDLLGKNISAAFKYTGEWKNNKLQGQGQKYLRLGNIEIMLEGDFQNVRLKFGHKTIRANPTNDTTQDLSIIYNLIPGDKVIKCFSSSLTKRKNKLVPSKH